METIVDYVRAAQKRAGNISERKLATMLGLKPNAVNFYIKKGTLPTDATMIKLAAIAGVDQWDALRDLTMWRTSNDPEVQKVWKKVFSTVQKAALVCSVLITIGGGAIAAEQPANNHASSNAEVYIITSLS